MSFEDILAAKECLLVEGSGGVADDDSKHVVVI